MNSRKTGMLLGCVVWGLSIGINLSCVLPVFTIIGGFTSFSRLAIQTTGKIIAQTRHGRNLFPIRQQQRTNLEIHNPPPPMSFIV